MDHRLLSDDAFNFWSMYSIVLVMGCLCVTGCECYRKQNFRRRQTTITITIASGSEQVMQKHMETRRKQVEKAMRETTIVGSSNLCNAIPRI